MSNHPKLAIRVGGTLPTAICVLHRNGGTLRNGVRACSSPLQVLTRRRSARALKLIEGGCAKIAQGAAWRQRWVVVHRASSGVGDCHVGGRAPPAPCWVVTVRAPPVHLAALALVVVHPASQAIAPWNRAWVRLVPQHIRHCTRDLKGAGGRHFARHGQLAVAQTVPIGAVQVGIFPVVQASSALVERLVLPATSDWHRRLVVQHVRERRVGFTSTAKSNRTAERGGPEIDVQKTMRADWVPLVLGVAPPSSSYHSRPCSPSWV